MELIASQIRAIKDFPKPGIIFRDITPLLANPKALRECIVSLTEPYRDSPPDLIAGMEARGFIFGSLVAQELGIGFVPLRKPGKLPAETHRHSYELEYGEATLEIHQDAVRSGQSVVVVDDLLATGGTASASCTLLEKVGATVRGCAFVIELDGLGGREQLAGYDLHVLVNF